MIRNNLFFDKKVSFGVDYDLFWFILAFFEYKKRRFYRILNCPANPSNFINLALSIMGKKIIKCSQCDQEFETGFDYRMHWETHLDDYFKKMKEANLPSKE